MVQKFSDMIENFLKNRLGEGITGIFEFIQLILTNVFDANAAGDITPGGLVNAHPTTWMGGSVWTLVKGVSDDVIMPIAGLLLLCVLVAELVKIMVDSNQFETQPFNVYMKWFLKMIIGIVLVSSVFDIVSWLFSIGVYVGQTAMTEVTGTPFATAPIIIPLDDFNIGALIIIFIVALLVFLGVAFMLLAIIISLAGRMIDIFMYFSIAPIPMATMMNGQWSSIGTNWIKGVAALAFQSFFAIIAIAVFTAIFGTVTNSIRTAASVGGLQVIVQMFTLLAFTLTLCFTILRTAQISKSIFNAS